MASPETPALVDCKQRHAEYPEHFHIPTDDELAALSLGYTVKVICCGERFWVVLTLVDGDQLAGRVAHGLVNTAVHGWKRGDVVTFERRHICAIEKLV